MTTSTRPRPARRNSAPIWKLKFAAARLALEAAEGRGAKLWDPQAGPQAMAAASPADVIGYGGQAGGGKTDLLVGLALTEHRKAIIFRREYGQLKDIVRRARQVSEGVRVGFNGSNNMLTMPGEATLEFGAMAGPDDWEKYKGRPHDLTAYDEATEFLEAQVRSSMGWNRTPVPGQRCRVVMTFNPPTNPEGRWVVKFFAPWLDPEHPNPAAPGAVRWFATVAGEETEVDSGEPFEAGGEAIYPQSRTFIPAKLSDNPHQDTPEYRRMLQSLPEPLRSQLLYGSFEAGEDEDPWRVIPAAWVRAAQGRWSEPAGPMTCVGLDVAHGGKDKTVAAPRHGPVFGRLHKFKGADTPTCAAAAAECRRVMGPGAFANVDAIGYGAAAQEKLAELGVTSRAINASARSEHADRSGMYRMVNVRAEMYWRLREALDPESGQQIALPPDPELLADLCAPRYKVTAGGIQIEAKADVAARLGRSPDCGDAAALAMLPEPAPPPRSTYGRSPAAGYRG